MYFPRKFYYFFAIFVVAFFLFLYLIFIPAPSNFPNNSVIKVSKGDSLSSLSIKLKDQSIVRSRFVFQTLVVLLGGARKISFGDYVFDKPMSVIRISYMIARGDHNYIPIKITIPEGYTNKKIADILHEKIPQIDSLNFQNIGYSSQGYLFPDTYFFSPYVTTDEIYSTMKDDFIFRTQAFKNDVKKSPYSLDQIVTMASIIEGEAKTDAERPIIAGILWKRIDMKMPLEVDVAPETYKTLGLPADPTCNPGLPSIESALHPKSSIYLFYLHDKNGNIHYATTYAEHIQNIKKYLK